MEYHTGQILQHKVDRGRVKILEVLTQTVLIASSEFGTDPLGWFSFEQIARDYTII